MSSRVEFRPAVQDDIDFIIETIIESDKSSTNVISACNIFSLSENEYKDILKNILLSNVESNEYSLSGFLIAEVKDKKLGALASWIEAIDGKSNSFIKSSLIFAFVERENLIKNHERMNLVNSLTLMREKGDIQFEYGYVIEGQRRKKIFTALIIESIRKKFSLGYKSNVQALLYRNNYRSFLAFEKLGFKVKAERTNNDPDIYKIFADNSKVLMELDKKPAEKLVENPFEWVIDFP